MLSPKRIKYRKIQKGNLGGKATKGNEVSFGRYGLQSLHRAGSRPSRSRLPVSP